MRAGIEAFNNADVRDVSSSHVIMTDGTWLRWAPRSHTHVTLTDGQPDNGGSVRPVGPAPGPVPP